MYYCVIISMDMTRLSCILPGGRGVGGSGGRGVGGSGGRGVGGRGVVGCNISSTSVN